MQELTGEHFSPRELVLVNAVAKARAAAHIHPAAVVLGGDTLVALGHRLIGKPRDLAAARKILRQLSGREHCVCSGVCLIAPRVAPITFSEISSVRFRKLTARMIDEYLARIDPLDKAGAYAAQENGEEIIAAIRGSKTNVIGLPMERLVGFLTRLGIRPAFNESRPRPPAAGCAPGPGCVSTREIKTKR